MLDFFHEGERIRFGVADWLRRDGALYLASGTFDDTELARGAAAGLETQPDYWGGSIAYRVTQAPLTADFRGRNPRLHGRCEQLHFDCTQTAGGQPIHRHASCRGGEKDE